MREAIDLHLRRLAGLLLVRGVARAPLCFAPCFSLLPVATQLGWSDANVHSNPLFTPSRNPHPHPQTGAMGPKAEDPEAAAIGAAALAFFRNRASAPRDMSATAAERFRAACDAVLRDIY